MNVRITESFAETCALVAGEMLELVGRKPDARLGLATGSTAEALYPLLVEAVRSGKADFSRVRTVNLDEYVGLAPDHPQSYRASMERWLFGPAGISADRVVVASGLGDPDEAVRQFRRKIAGGGRVDFQLLGIGVNGHIGFNEARDYLCAYAHREQLSQETIDANSRFFDSPDQVPREAITMGMGEILQAERIVLAATGAQKAEAIRELLSSERVTTTLPASFIKLHPNCTVVIDRELANLAGYKEEQA